MINQPRNIFGKLKQPAQDFKNTIKILLVALFLHSACTNSTDQKEIKGVEFYGETQGTTYQIIIAEDSAFFTNQEIIEQLAVFDSVLSTYIDSSIISKMNAVKTSGVFIDTTRYLKECLQESESVYSMSQGAFDPSVYPLVEGWGFMKNMQTPLSKEKVDSILKFVSFEKNKLFSISFVGDTIFYTKKDQRFKLDFNAIAQGLAVDMLSNFIRRKGHKNFYVEIGGEILVKGHNRSGKPWNIGVDMPTNNSHNSDARQLINVLSISDKAIATSGNYRKFYVKNGKKYAHTLNPKNGFPVNHSLLSATVVADKVSTADAYATVFMVLGLSKTKEFLEKYPELDVQVYLVYENKNGQILHFKSSGMKQFFEKG
jgi:thiamine biosynthesis lipoprotein